MKVEVINMIKKLLKTTLLVTAISSIFVIPASATTVGYYQDQKTGAIIFCDENFKTLTGWQQYKNDGWLYLNQDGTPTVGWKVINGQTYRFDQFGLMETGVVNLGGTIYNFAEDGHLIQ
jgi:glucan-binding YG repeat protein